jgi:DNA gyrase inhibitor GyrI
MINGLFDFMLKKVAKLFFISVFVLVLAIFSFLFYMGAFQKVVVKTEHKGPYTMAYVEHVGSYSKISEPMKEMGEKLADAGFDYSRSVGIYHNDPKSISKDQLRSEIGYIIADGDMDKIEANKDKFNFYTIEEGDYAVTYFPLRNVLSYMFGPWKVYPAFERYFEEKKMTSYSASVEIYDTKNKNIIFLIKTND